MDEVGRMNIFVLDENPEIAARMYCDKHSPKMVVELLQQLGSSVIRHGATPEQMPLTKKQTPLKGGYHNHPATKWCGESRENYAWASRHALELCLEYTRRFNKIHFCEAGIKHLYSMAYLIPKSNFTPFALCMPDEFKTFDNEVMSHATAERAVKAYRAYYHSKEFAAWNKGTPAPSWWQGEITTTSVKPKVSIKSKSGNTERPKARLSPIEKAKLRNMNQYQMEF
tara:strand:+ start:861 stop:1538 length:678 start_codon:yes stop_codon:yes gene_type:complete